MAWPGSRITMFWSFLTGVLLYHVTTAQVAPHAVPLIDPYRPNVYFGLQSKAPNGLWMGLMWGPVGTDMKTSDFRHTVEADQLSRWGWQYYDPRTGGAEILVDQYLGWNLSITYARASQNVTNNDFTLSIDATPTRTDADALKVVLYTGIKWDGPPDDGAFLNCAKPADVLTMFRRDIVVVCEQRLTYQSANTLYFTKSPAGNGKLAALGVDIDMLTTNVTSDDLWRVKELYLQGTAQNELQRLFSKGVLRGNLQFFETTVEQASSLGVIYVENMDANTFKEISMPVPRTKEASVKIKREFFERLDRIYPPTSPFATSEHREFASSMISNLLGGLGYFLGDVKVNRAAANGQSTIQTEGPYELFTAVPSRSFFSRGFLWDEGFHQLVIMDWDLDITLEVLDSWYRLLDADGWVAREQILGDEARSKVPKEFQIQDPTFANPPTFFLVVDQLLDYFNGTREYRGHASSFVHDRDQATQYLLHLYPLLKSQHEWFCRTQRGLSVLPDLPGYRWRGRTDQHTLTSGLDDYPRAVPASTTELHVDLLSWVGLMARVLARMAEIIGELTEQTEYLQHFQRVKDSLDRVHWSESDQIYCDITTDPSQRRVFVCEKGYISLFPFVTGMLDTTHPHVGAVLDLTQDPAHLWSPCGLRSLSPSSSYYGKDENYWRGPIWININYMVLTQLLSLAQSGGPHKDRAKQIYIDLRRNIVNTVLESWIETGFIWEQYNQDTGKGQRTKGFTGWTTLVVKIMSMPDLEWCTQSMAAKADQPLRSSAMTVDGNYMSDNPLYKLFSAVVGLSALAFLARSRRVATGVRRIFLRLTT